MIAVSEHVRQELIAAGLPSARAHTVLNGIDFNRATRVTRPKPEVLAELGIRPGEDFLLMLGWDPVCKGVDLALDAVQDLADAGQRLRLGVVGNEKLQAYLRAQGAEERYPCLRVLAPREDIASLYQAASVFLSPSRSEGFTYAVCEAMANGIPVVLSDIPPVAWARGSPGAVFCTPNDSRSLAEAIRQVLAWPAGEREDRVSRGREFARRDFDVRNWAQRVFGLYQEIIGPGR